MSPDETDEPLEPILDIAYDVPDCIFQIVKTSGGGALRGRLWVSPGHDFIEFDKRRWFVRALFPVPVEGGLEFRFGVWLELPSKAEFHHVMKTWDDPVEYPRLAFEARIANDLERQDVLGEHVHACGVVDVNEKPRVYTADKRSLSDLLKYGWTKAEYDRFLDGFERKLDAAC